MNRALLQEAALDDTYNPHTYVYNRILECFDARPGNLLIIMSFHNKATFSSKIRQITRIQSTNSTFITISTHDFFILYFFHFIFLLLLIFSFCIWFIRYKKYVLSLIAKNVQKTYICYLQNLVYLPKCFEYHWNSLILYLISPKQFYYSYLLKLKCISNVFVAVYAKYILKITFFFEHKKYIFYTFK